MNTINYYLRSRRYAGPLEEWPCGDILNYYTISTRPVRIDADGKPYDRGWFDVVDEWAVGAHGAYSTLERAREAIQAMAPGARQASEGEIYFTSEGDVEYWVPPVRLLTCQLDAWASLHGTTVEIAMAIALSAGWDLETMEQRWEAQAQFGA
jgi:hypothetical protein